jgi:phosphate transport system permease protein
MNNVTLFSISSTSNLPRRHRKGKYSQAIFFSSTTIGIIALIVLLLSIINQAFGLVAIENKIDPATLASEPLDRLSKDELVNILTAGVSKNRLRVINKNTPLDEATQKEIYRLVIEEVVEPQVVESYFLLPSLFNRNTIIQQIADKHPAATIEFKAWLNPKLLRNSMSTIPDSAGVRTALFGSLWVIFITIAFAFPIGIGAAIYLEEYAKSGWVHKVIQTNIDNLAGVPSIVYGILGLAIFVRSMNHFTSGALFGIDQTNGRTIISASLTMALLILPLLIINAQEAIRSVPNSLRQASFGLGATRWQTIWHHVLPNALPGILTGTILSISRAMGETAPLILVGASSFINKDPTSIFSNFTVLPIQIYNWTARPQGEFRNIAAAAILVLLAALLTLNAAAILFRNRLSKRQL